MKEYIVKEFTEFVTVTNFESSKSVEEWLSDEINDNVKKGYVVETISQSMSSADGTLYRSILLVMSK